MPSTRTQAELRSASEHLHYELLMLNETAAALTTPNALPNEVLTNACLEAFAIHARVLLQFFFQTGRLQDSDVLAVHYVADEATWNTALGPRPTTLGEVNSRVGTEIAHLSYNRLQVGPEAKGWSVRAIQRAILGLVAVFVEHVPSDKLAVSWNDGRILGTPSTVGTDRGVMSTTNTSVPTIIGPAYAIPQPEAVKTKVNTLTPPVRFTTSK